MSEAQLEHSGLVKLASMDEPVLAALVEHVLVDDELPLSSVESSRVNKTADGEWHPRKRGTPAR